MLPTRWPLITMLDFSLCLLDLKRKLVPELEKRKTKSNFKIFWNYCTILIAMKLDNLWFVNMFLLRIKNPSMKIQFGYLSFVLEHGFCNLIFKGFEVQIPAYTTENVYGCRVNHPYSHLSCIMEWMFPLLIEL